MDDYKERMKREYWELKSRYARLMTMMIKDADGSLEFEFTCPRELLREQLYVMGRYLHVLEQRAEYEGVDLGG